MKKLYTITVVFLLTVFSLSSQITVIDTGINNPSSFAISGNDLYFSQEFPDIVSKADISQALPLTHTDVLTGLDAPSGMVISGNELFIAQFAGGTSGQGKISKIDITSASPTVVDVLTGLSGPNRLLLDGNELYFSESSNGTLSKINITDSNPTPIEIVNGIDFPGGMLLIGNELYFTALIEGRILKVDITQPFPGTPSEVVTGLGRAGELVLINGDIYVSQLGEDKISQIDITQPTPVVTTYLTGVDNPFGLLYNNGDLYITEFNGARIVKTQFAFFTAPSSLCDNAGVQSGIGGGSPTGGVYAGPGVTDDGNGMTYSFDPAVAGVGTHSLSYLVNGVTSSDDIEVLPTTAVTLDLPDTLYMTQAMPQLGLGGGFPSGGIYTANLPNEMTDDGNGMTFSFTSNVTIGDFIEITYSFTAANGCESTIAKSIFIADLSTGISELNESDINVFPNPTSGLVEIEGAIPAQIELIDVHGRLLRLENNPSSILDISKFANGIYFLKIKIDEQVITKRIIKE